MSVGWGSSGTEGQVRMWEGRVLQWGVPVMETLAGLQQLPMKVLLACICRVLHALVSDLLDGW